MVWTRQQQRIFEEILRERSVQDGMHGQQNHHPIFYLSILAEEVGEAFKAANDAHFSGDLWSHCRDELVQVAAVTVAIIECIDRGLCFEEVQ